MAGAAARKARGASAIGPAPLAADASAAAGEAATAPGEPLPLGLVHVSDEMPGITRVARGKSFAYRTSDGRWLRDEAELSRIRKLAIPPAYRSVWICPHPDGHLQATGRDARGRKQYRYHPRWQELRDDYKFGRMEAFGRALPRIRTRVARDLAGAQSARSLRREVVLATLVRLLDTTFLRVGNDEYARSNKSYGLTTLRNRHAGVQGSTLHLSFRGKSGVVHRVSLDDPRVARVVRRAQQLPGQELFQYEEPDGTVRSVGSSDVNDYLEAIAGGERFTAKDFRTWHGSVQALELLRLARLEQQAAEAAAGATGAAAVSAAEASSKSAAAPMTPKQVIAEVARRLGNTPAVCRKAYIHPEVLSLGMTATAEVAEAAWAKLVALRRAPRGLSAAEARLLAYLRHARRGAARGLEDQLKRSLRSARRKGR